MVKNHYPIGNKKMWKWVQILTRKIQVKENIMTTPIMALETVIIQNEC